MTVDTIHNLIKQLDVQYPDKTPTTPLSEFEYGVLAGQRLLIETLKVRYKFGEIDTIEEEV